MKIRLHSYSEYIYELALEMWYKPRWNTSSNTNGLEIFKKLKFWYEKSSKNTVYSGQYDAVKYL